MLEIAGVKIGGDNPCRFVAEISNNHNGSLDRALRLVDAAKAAGADFIKWQCYMPDELVALRGDGPAPAQWGEQGWTMRALYEKAQTPHDWFPRLVQHCESAGIPWFSSVFGRESLAMLRSLDCPAYKIARLDNSHRWLIEACIATGKPVLASAAIGQVDERWWFEPVFALYCPPGYPTPIEDVRLPAFDQPFGGLSSHCLDPRLPVAAVARGAKLLEYHFQLADEPSELERDVSLYDHEFAAMVEDVRATEAMLA